MYIKEHFIHQLIIEVPDALGVGSWLVALKNEEERQVGGLARSCTLDLPLFFVSLGNGLS